MDVATVKLLVDQVMLDAAEDRLPEAEARLTDLLQGIGIPQTPAMKNAACQCLIARATVYQYANRWQEALDDLDSSEKIALTLSPLGRISNLHNVYFARALLMATPFIPAYNLDLAEEALTRLRQIGSAEWVADELESVLAYRSKAWRRAARAARSAAQTQAAQGWQAGAMNSRLRAGLAYLELGDWNAAQAELAPALHFFSQYGPPSSLANAQMAQARLELSRGSPDLAWELANRSLKGVEGLIRNFKALFDQQLFMLDKIRFYDEAFVIGQAKGGVPGSLCAWTIAEQAKSFYLCQLVANADIPLFEGIAEDQIARLRDLERQLDHCETKLGRLRNSGLDPEHRAELEDQFRAISETHRQMLESIMRANPRWAALRAPPPFELETELKRLDPAWVPISFFWQNQDQGAMLHIFYAGSDREPHHLQTTWSQTDLERLEGARSKLTGTVNPAAPLFPPDLTERILPPVLLASLEPGQCLLISPHGRLQALPLHALPLPSGERLITRFPVQYLPTLALLPLHLTRSSRSARPPGVMLLGCAQDGFGDGPLDDVPDEIRALEDLWSARRPGLVSASLIPPDGSLADAGLPLKGWDAHEYIHVACHGIFPEGQPLDAALRLGQEALRASEFFAIRLNAGLVSLSACALGQQATQTSGMDLRGDEWVGLYLPLFYAGAGTLLVSLWNADSRTAMLFMRALHTALSQGTPPAQAFQKAELSVSRRPAPLWANWYLVGFPEQAQVQP